MFNNKKSPSVPVFQVKKKHSWRANLIRLLEVLLITVVLIGTLIWYLLQSHFSLSNFLHSAQQTLIPKIDQKTQVKQQLAQDQLKQSIQDSRVFEIDTINDVQDGFEVKAKSGLVVVFSKEKDFGETISTLQTLLAKAKIDNKTIKHVDFRFDKIIVEY